MKSLSSDTPSQRIVSRRSNFEGKYVLAVDFQALEEQKALVENISTFMSLRNRVLLRGIATLLADIKRQELSCDTRVVTVDVVMPTSAESALS
jgi:hypothetical protein